MGNKEKFLVNIGGNPMEVSMNDMHPMEEVIFKDILWKAESDELNMPVGVARVIAAKVYYNERIREAIHDEKYKLTMEYFKETGQVK